MRESDAAGDSNGGCLGAAPPRYAAKVKLAAIVILNKRHLQFIELDLLYFHPKYVHVKVVSVTGTSVFLCLCILYGSISP